MYNNHLELVIYFRSPQPLPSSASQATMMVEMAQSQQQQDVIANAGVPMYEVQTVAMELEPETSATVEDVNTSSDDVFSTQNVVNVPLCCNN